MEIRAAREEDRSAITSLISAYPEQLEQEHIPDTGDFFIALEGEKLVGCCAIEIYSPKIAEVRSLAVKPEMQGKGIATALVEQCVEKAKAQNVRQVLAITSSLEFFEKRGFKAFNNEKYALFRILK